MSKASIANTIGKEQKRKEKERKAKEIKLRRLTHQLVRQIKRGQVNLEHFDITLMRILVERGATERIAITETITVTRK